MVKSFDTRELTSKDDFGFPKEVWVDEGAYLALITGFDCKEIGKKQTKFLCAHMVAIAKDEDLTDQELRCPDLLFLYDEETGFDTTRYGGRVKWEQFCRAVGVGESEATPVEHFIRAPIVVYIETNDKGYKQIKRFEEASPGQIALAKMYIKQAVQDAHK